MTSGNRTLPIVTSCHYSGSVELGVNIQTFTYDMHYKYDARGRITEETEVFDGNGRDDLIGSETKKTYGYDTNGRITEEKIYRGGETSPSESREYEYDPSGRVKRILSGADSRNYTYDSRGRREKSLYYNGISFMPMLSYMYVYDNYGNRIRKSYASQGGGEGNVIREYTWTRGSCLTGIKDGGSIIATYDYDRNGIRFNKTVGDIATKYYRDGNKILGEDKSDGKKIRYMYDVDGVSGFRYYDGEKWIDFTYVKDMHGSVIMVKNDIGAPLVRYTYDIYGRRAIWKVTSDGYEKPEYADIIGELNPFGWKGHYYDNESGYYYIDGRYYDPDEGIYVDAEPIENMFANAETLYGQDRYTAWYDNSHSMSPYAYTAMLLTELIPSTDKAMTAEYTLSHEKAWWSWIPNAVELIAGVAMMCTPLFVSGIALALTGVVGLTGNIAAIQTLGGASIFGGGVQSLINGVQLISGACNPVSVILGLVGIVSGVTNMSFGMAEIQEGLGYGNWIKDSGMSEGLYERSMLISGAVSIFVNIAGPIANKYGAKCFAAGTIVHTRTGLKAIEEIEVGDEVLSYDEETGTQEYKPVVRLYRNATEEWYVIRADGEELKCTGEHPFYIEGKGFTPARGIHSLDKVLQRDGRYVIIESIEKERLTEPETTYNFEVADNHTYYVGNGILTHNKCGFDNYVKDPKSLWGQTSDDVAQTLGEGWTKGSYGSKRTGWKFTNGDKLIAYHPGGGRHVGNYYKLSSSTIGKIKVVGIDYVHYLGDKAIIFNIFSGG